METFILLAVLLVISPTQVCRVVMASPPKTRGDWAPLAVFNFAFWPAVLPLALAGFFFIAVEQLKPYLRPMRVGIF